MPSQFYRGKRTRNIFDPERHGPGQEFFRLSRSKLELFLRCPFCFYLDRRLGVNEPPGFPFSLNAAVDHLLKKEFDRYRELGEPHPIMTAAGLRATPFQHPKLESWRDNFSGVEARHEPSGFVVTGAVDDLWRDESGQIIVVDYKATSKDEEVNLDADWQRGYKNQVEIYQWLLRQNGLTVSPVAYFVYANGRRDRPNFNGRLEFSIKLIPYRGDDAWVGGSLVAASECLRQPKPPTPTEECDLCTYRQAVTTALPPPQAPSGSEQVALF